MVATAIRSVADGLGKATSVAAVARLNEKFTEHINDVHRFQLLWGGAFALPSL